MIYTSTRDASVRVSAAEAIAKGISEDGGLFVPMTIPTLNLVDIEKLARLDYIGRAKEVLKLYLTDFTEDELAMCVEGAYKAEKFSSPKIAPLYKLNDNAQILELWRGPTCAFKDMALQLLPYLLTVSANKTLKDTKIVILVATSGDTGKAALEGFKDVPNTEILVFYPVDGVSPMQKLQMTTQEGKNVSVCAIEGNFDDAQSGVKAIFTNQEIKEKFEENHLAFSSANSINWGRLVPQIVYYVSAYCDLVKSGEVKLGDPMNVVVPTGNFGNILAAYYAKVMGIPINRLICASNQNNVLTDFINTGTYDRNRTFYNTLSPSMDILISSNLERMLFELSGRDDKLVREYMSQLAEYGSYRVDSSIRTKLKREFSAGYCDDQQTKDMIARMWNEQNYLIDPHTAVAFHVLEEYREETGDDTVTVAVSTASPFKFCDSVLDALGVKEHKAGLEILDQLTEITGVPTPAPLARLKKRRRRFDGVVDKAAMKGCVLDFLK